MRLPIPSPIGFSLDGVRLDSVRLDRAVVGHAPRAGVSEHWDVVVEKAARGIDVAEHRVAAVSYVRDFEDAGWRSLPRALRFLGQSHVETVALKIGLLRERSAVPKLL